MQVGGNQDRKAIFISRRKSNTVIAGCEAYAVMRQSGPCVRALPHLCAYEKYLARRARTRMIIKTERTTKATEKRMKKQRLNRTNGTS